MFFESNAIKLCLTDIKYTIVQVFPLFVQFYFLSLPHIHLGTFQYNFNSLSLFVSILIHPYWGGCGASG